MFRSVFGRQEQTPSQQQQQPPLANPPSNTGSSPGLTSLNPLSRQGNEASTSTQERQDYKFHSGTSQAQNLDGRSFTQGQGYPQGHGYPQGQGPQGGQYNSNSGAGMMGPSGSMPIKRHFPELANLSAEEIRVLLTDPVAYHKFLHNIDEVKQMDKVVEDLQKSDVELAKSTLALESTISELQTQCRIIRGTELASAQQQLQQLQARHHEVYSTLGPAALIARVQDGAKAANKESEELQAKMSRGEIDLTTFIREYMAKRKEYHLRTQSALAALASLTNH